MPIFTPSRRWQQAYYSFKKRSLSEQLEEGFERIFKGALWGCRMCGNCLLQETAFICPMACPKGLRNGPCGGSTPEHCCVDESRPCIWYAIYHRAEKMGRLDKLVEVLPPLDWDKTGTSAIRNVTSKLHEKGVLKVLSSAVRSTPYERKQNWDCFFMEIRQPDWWAGDSQPHPAPVHEPVSKLEQILTSCGFAITCEVVPPASSDFSKLDAALLELKDVVDAVNITDSASSVPRISPMACSLRAIEMAARDRTRISFQADLMGASASGIRNLLLITGDHPNKGNPPFSRMDIWDYDSVQAIWMARKLRDEDIFLDGRETTTPPSYFIGAAASPYASLPEYQAIRAEKKVNAGAQFFQTNLIFDIDRFEEYLEALDKRGILSRITQITCVNCPGS
jgi:5,10-methylenetetrahydrofolate reductase